MDEAFLTARRNRLLEDRRRALELLARAQNERGGEEGAALKAELARLEAEIRELEAQAAEVLGEVDLLEAELQQLREETRRARRHALSLRQ